MKKCLMNSKNYNADDDFLQALADESATKSMVEYWIEQLLKSTGKSTQNELTNEEIRKEIEEVKKTIRNEEILIGITDYAEENIKQFEAYIEKLEEMLSDKKN